MSRLKELLKEKGVKQAALARAVLGQGEHTARQWRRYQRKDEIPDQFLQPTASFLEMTVQELEDYLNPYQCPGIPELSRPLAESIFLQMEKLRDADCFAALPRRLLPEEKSGSQVLENQLLIEDLVKNKGSKYSNWFGACCALVSSQTQLDELLKPLLTLSAAALTYVELDEHGLPVDKLESLIQVENQPIDNNQQFAKLLGTGLRLRYGVIKDLEIEELPLDTDCLGDERFPFSCDFDLVIPPCQSADVDQLFEKFEEQLAHALGFRPRPSEPTSEEKAQYQAELVRFVSEELVSSSKSEDADKTKAQSRLTIRVESADQPLAFGIDICDELADKIRDKYKKLYFVICSQSEGEAYLRSSVGFFNFDTFIEEQVNHLNRAQTRLTLAEGIEAAIKAVVLDGEDDVKQIQQKLLELAKKPTESNLKVLEKTLAGLKAVFREGHGAFSAGKKLYDAASPHILQFFQ
ncbi:MAG: hypothetical protein ACPGYX_00140 [Oceanobacter sp.]